MDGRTYIKVEVKSSDEDSDDDRRYSGPPREPLVDIQRKEATGSLVVVSHPDTEHQEKTPETVAVRDYVTDYRERPPKATAARNIADDQIQSRRSFDSEPQFADTEEESEILEDTLLYYLCCGCCFKGDQQGEALLQDQDRREANMRRTSVVSQISTYSYSLPYDGSYRPPIVQINPEIPDAQPINPP